LIEPALELDDIVTAHQCAGQELKHSITELPTRFVKATKRVRPDYAVSSQAALLLKSANCDIAVVVEHITVIGVAEESQVRKPCAHLRDGRPG
jgi:hypothetical protein